MYAGGQYIMLTFVYTKSTTFHKHTTFYMFMELMMLSVFVHLALSFHIQQHGFICAYKFLLLSLRLVPTAHDHLNGSMSHYTECDCIAYIVLRKATLK